MSHLENWEENFEYIWCYSTNLSKIFMKMTPLCLPNLPLVIDDFGSLGQCQNLQNSSIVKRAYF